MLPLEGLLVIALEQAVAAPLCTQRLADAGARVIKIERAGGEIARHYDASVLGTSAYFASLNRGKESIVLDIKAADDRALLERMVARADVFVRNLAPGATARLGLRAADLAERYKRLIVVDILGYDQGSSHADRLAYDMLVQAESGICAVTGTPEEPVKVGCSMTDLGTGANAHAAILEALLERGITGRGKAIEIAMFDVMAELMSVPILHHDYAARDTPRHGLAHAAIAPYGKVACKDGDVVIVCQQHAEWVRFCQGVLQRPDLISDARFASNPDRVANSVELYEIIANFCATTTRAGLISRLDANKLPWANVSTMPELSAHPALRRIEIELPGGRARIPASPLRDTLKPGPVPETGAQSKALRKEFAG